MVTRLEQADIAAPSASSGRQAALNVGVVEPECKYLGEFFGAERANGNHEKLKESLRKFLFLLIDSQQRTAICFIQSLRQVVQGIPDTRRKTMTQRVHLADNPSKPTT